MLVKVKALTNGYHQKYQAKGSEFYYDAKEDEKKSPILARWMKLVEVVKKPKVKKAKKEAE
jgi:hypothetical protein